MTTVAGVVDDVAEFDAESRAISSGGTATGRCKHEWLESMSEIQNVSGRVLVDFVRQLTRAALRVGSEMVMVTGGDSVGERVVVKGVCRNGAAAVKGRAR